MLLVNVPLPMTEPPVIWNAPIDFDSPPMFNVPPEMRRNCRRAGLPEVERAGRDVRRSRVRRSVHAGDAAAGLVQTDRAAEDRIHRARLDVVSGIAAERARAGYRAAGALERPIDFDSPPMFNVPPEIA